jgi:hypothetical protein
VTHCGNDGGRRRGCQKQNGCQRPA